MKVKMIPIEIGALGTITKGWVQGLDDLEVRGPVVTIDDGLVWFVWFYGISTFVGYLTPNPFLCK